MQQGVWYHHGYSKFIFHSSWSRRIKIKKKGTSEVLLSGVGNLSKPGQEFFHPGTQTHRNQKFLKTVFAS